MKRGTLLVGNEAVVWDVTLNVLIEVSARYQWASGICMGEPSLGITRLFAHFTSELDTYRFRDDRRIDDWGSLVRSHEARLYR